MYRSAGLGFAFVFLLLMGCAGLQQLEAFGDARMHMLAAAQMENIQQFHEAVLEYVYVARNFPTSSFSSTAILKAAILSGHPDNPKRNLNASLYWLNEYLKMPLSEQEQESIQFLITQVKQNRQYQDKMAQLQKKLAFDKDQIKERDKQILQLESEISEIQEALERIKEIDVRIHQRRLK